MASRTEGGQVNQLCRGGNRRWNDGIEWTADMLQCVGSLSAPAAVAYIVLSAVACRRDAWSEA